MDPKKLKPATTQPKKDLAALDPRNQGASWSLQDIYWDEDGCLYINDEKLARQIYDAIWVTHHFCITMDDKNKGSGGGVGGNKINAQCPC